MNEQLINHNKNTYCEWLLPYTHTYCHQSPNLFLNFICTLISLKSIMCANLNTVELPTITPPTTRNISIYGYDKIIAASKP